jgi:hypothetical protein
MEERRPLRIAALWKREKDAGKLNSKINELTQVDEADEGTL